MNARRALLLLGVLLLPGLPAGADDDWRVVRAEDGIELSRRAGEPPAFRGITVIEASLPHVLAVIRDVPRHVEWRSRCVEARVLDSESRHVATLYSRQEGSWPIADRDAVLRTETTVDGPDAARIDLRAVDSPLAPEPGGAVRMWLDGAYALAAEGPTRTRVDYRMQVRLGGSVPEWLARFATEDMPFSTLSGLRSQVAATRGAYRAFEEAWPEAARRGEIPSAD